MDISEVRLSTRTISRVLLVFFSEFIGPVLGGLTVDYIGYEWSMTTVALLAVALVSIYTFCL